ncbi:hypothetical protein THF1D04_20486 [Vibrio owensii]|uniref:Uncharacterized protein n=1 Tax=Vibrio owensii TaxID=696485 RepID=A0AAU9Q6N3_9VIBR|nr:hypothetical protein THF1D04_20486 [Vibrio owensii]
MLDNFDAGILSLSVAERRRNLVVQGDNSAPFTDIWLANWKHVCVRQ